MPGPRSAPNVLSLTGRLLQRVVQVCCARPALTVLVAFALAALGVGYAAHSLTIETSKFHLLPLHQRYATLYKDYAEDFGQLEDIVVVVQGPAVDTRRMEAHALLYLPVATLQDTLQTVATHEELLADFAATPTLAQLVEGINQSVGAPFLPDVFGPGARDEPNPAPTRLLRD